MLGRISGCIFLFCLIFNFQGDFNVQASLRSSQSLENTDIWQLQEEVQIWGPILVV